ncbi:hypothetical protein N825_17525 [Skermanella stibiiresistens SB22]|uniref:Uncharacterized protein n=1 Tax=Skermanella stibiiresistens SB22 TaxID=1385369 RepID=W9GU29_9PROT|nr:hypothetical protein [Skermanella stibiiresistens]EWY37410.1 hypothetical protein N825_17525 [Skermanella stibiiresistens SB22]
MAILDGMPAEEKRRRFAEMISQMTAERFPDAEDLPFAIAAVGALSGSRFFGVRYKAEAAGARAWVARPHGPERTEVWDLSAPDFTWNYSDTLPGGAAAFTSDEAGMKRLHALFDAKGTALTALGRRIHALLTGTEPDDD